MRFLKRPQQLAILSLVIAVLSCGAAIAAAISAVNSYKVADKAYQLMSASYSPTVTAVCREEYDEVSKTYYDTIKINNSTGQVIVIGGIPQTFMSITLLKVEDGKIAISKNIWIELKGYFGSLQVTGNTQGLLFEPLKAEISSTKFALMKNDFQQSAQKDGYIGLIDLYRYATIIYMNKYGESNSKPELHYFPIAMNSNSYEIPESDYMSVSRPVEQNLELAITNGFGLTLTVDHFNGSLLWDFCKNYILAGDSQGNQQ
ncbi:MAG: hypothetical protein WCD72_05710 [Dehalococcoidia bacterium]